MEKNDFKTPRISSKLLILVKLIKSRSLIKVKKWYNKMLTRCDVELSSVGIWLLLKTSHVDLAAVFH